MKGITILENLEVDLDSARKWYQKLEAEYQHLKWSVAEDIRHPKDSYDEPNIYKESYAWSLSILETHDPEKPYHKNLNPMEKDYRKYIKSSACFSWGEKVLNLFPKTYRNYVFVSAPGTIFSRHRDGSDYLRIHIPIHTSNQCIWSLEDGDYTLPAGKVYVVDVRNYHGTINNSQINRVHLTLEIKKEHADYIYKLQGII